jgi:hypothetical protein
MGCWYHRDHGPIDFHGPARRAGSRLLHRGKTSFGMLQRMRRSCCVRPVLPPRSAFAGFRFPREVIVLAVRWYLRYGTIHRARGSPTRLRTAALGHARTSSQTESRGSRWSAASGYGLSSMIQAFSLSMSA